jgi:hypothetical protein
MKKIDELLTVNLPGEFAVVSHTFDDGSVIYGMHFRCPCGCGSVDYVPIAPGDKKDHAWQWDGNRESPTLSPSLLRYTPCAWHGFMHGGKWNWCAGTPVAANCMHAGTQL